MNDNQILAMLALKNMLDDFPRAATAFRNLTEADIRAQHGRSGETREQIIARHEPFGESIREAIEWVKSK